MNDPKCKDCQHFLQHYTYLQGKWRWVYCGHCTHLRVRTKRPDAPACENFVQGTPASEAFITKEYLSMELLKYVLSLDLPPAVEEMPQD